MNELSQYLVEQMLLEDENPIKKVVVIYGGRFQPFHKGHYGTYQHLVKKFGKNNVFISTSNKVEKPKSPFNFKEKVKIMTTMFNIPKSKIVQVRNNYAPKEILDKYDKETTAFVTVVGEKDSGRLGGKYFRPWKGKAEIGYEEGGYVYASPSQGRGISGTETRNGLSVGSDEQKQNFFKNRAYGKFNMTIFKMITDKLNEGIEIPKEVIEEWLINESSNLGGNAGSDVDDGPSFFFPNYDVFSKVNIDRAKKIGWEVLNMITTQEIEDYYDHPNYPNGPVKATSFFPAGIIGNMTPNNQIDIYSSGAYSQWFKHATRKATLAGYELVKSISAKADISQDKNQSGNLAKGDKELKDEFENSLNENIVLPVKVGDTILTGRFKNKKVTVKTIGKDEHGMPTINGKKVVTFRLMKEGFQAIFEDEKEDEKYTHVGNGNYKLKGKEGEDDPTFKKDDSGKYIELDKDGKTKPQPKQGTSLKQGGYDNKVKKEKEIQKKISGDTSNEKPQPKEEPKSKVTTLQGKKSGKEIQNLGLDGGGKVYGTEHGETAMVDDILDDVKKNIPKERWKDIVFVGEGGATGDNGELEFNDEMDYAVPKFKELGAGIDTWDGDEMDVHNDQSKLYKRQMEKTGLNQSQVNAGNWASMIGQGEGTDTMSPDDFLDDEGKEYIQSAAKEAGFPPIENWENPTGETPSDENDWKGSGDKGTLYRLAFPEDNKDKQTKIGDIQDAFNETRDEHLIKKSKELSSQGKIPIVIAGESHVGLVDKMMKNESIGLRESIAGTEVKCEKCNHSWEIESEDTEKYLCHSCGWDSQKQEYDFDAFDSWQEKMGLSEDVDIDERSKGKLRPADLLRRKAKMAGKRAQIQRRRARTMKRRKSIDKLKKIAYKKAYLEVYKEFMEDLFPGKTKAELTIQQAKVVHKNVLRKKKRVLKRARFKFLPKLRDAEVDKFDNKSNISFNKPKETNEMSKSTLNKIEKYAEKQLSPEDIEFTKHFFDRLNDPRNGKEISDAELTGFFKRLSKYKKKFKEFLEKYQQIVVKDKRHDINIPFVKQANQIIAKTVMRKDDFKTSNPVLAFEQLAKGMSLRDIAEKHEVSFEELKKEAGKGVKVEMEHTSDVKVAYDIAKDHLFEDPKYYTKLATIEEVGVGTGQSGIRMGYPSKDDLKRIEKRVKKQRNNTDSNQEYQYEPIREGKELKKLGITDFKSLFKKMPSDLQKRVYNLKNFGQRIDKHPEGNVLKHTITVVNRSIKEDDIDIAIAAMFHDIGKDETAGIHPKKGHITHFGHEKVSANLVNKYKKWIESVGGNVDTVHYIVKNHMRYKQLSDMRPKKQSDLKSHPNFDKLSKFSKHDRGGLGEGIITEGGAYGHMSHPFDTDINLTFGQLKDIVNRALEGTLEFTREKTDGQALAISWRDGRLVAARNKGHLKNKGENALDIKGVSDKFQGRGGLSDAYNYAMKDLSNAISSLNDKQRDKIFKQGACFMNLEVIYPTSVNVIPYGQALLVFHGTMEYNDEGVAIGENGEAARILAGMIKQVNKDVQDNYTIQGPPVVKLPKSTDLSKKRSKYSSQISKLQKEFGLKDTDGVANYHQAWWEQWVDKNSPSTLDNKTKMGLVKRWAFMDKKFRLDNKNITDSKTLEWAKKIDKEDQKKISKQNLMKFEQIFLGLGAEVLEFTSSALTVNPDAAVRDMKKRIDKTIKDVKKSGDPKKIEKLKLELQRLNSIGGSKKIVPNEGIVFLYNGNTFKLTGTFASVNQILGIFF